MVQNSSAILLSIDEADAAKLQLDWAAFKPFPTHFLGVSAFDAGDVDRVRTYFDWSTFVRKWELPMPFPAVLDSPEWGGAARKLMADVNALLDELLTGGLLTSNVVFGVWRAYADGQNVIVLPDNGPATTLCFLRNQSVKPPGPAYCLADFIKPGSCLNDGEFDYLGGYALTLGVGIAEKARQLEADYEDYRLLLLTDLCRMYRTALADYLHYRLRRFIWAYCDDDDLSNEEILTGAHQGIRTEMGKNECPDASERTKLIQLLGIDTRAFGLPDDCTDDTPLATCGYFFAHPQSRNFRIDTLSDEQLERYARNKGVPRAQVEACLSAIR